MRENDLLARLPRLFATDDPSVVIGSGPDDCAHVSSPDARIAFSTDAFVENVHFLPEDSPEAVAVKALTASVSDLAASACAPKWALVCLCLKKGAPEDWAGRFAQALAKAAKAYALTIVGGDVTSSPNDTVVSVTVAGVPMAGGPLLRSGAKPGDAIIVTGSLGGSILGRHLRPVARVSEIGLLMDFCLSRGVPPPHACMDISDGLALDLSRMCRESGVGAVVDAELVPVADAARKLAGQSGRTALHHALTDGEDFELLITMPVASWDCFEEERRKNGGVDPETGKPMFTRVGTITGEKDLLLRDANGEVRSLSPEGYEHQW